MSEYRQLMRAVLVAHQVNIAVRGTMLRSAFLERREKKITAHQYADRLKDVMDIVVRGRTAPVVIDLETLRNLQ